MMPSTRTKMPRATYIEKLQTTGAFADRETLERFIQREHLEKRRTQTAVALEAGIGGSTLRLILRQGRKTKKHQFSTEGLRPFLPLLPEQGTPTEITRYLPTGDGIWYPNTGQPKFGAKRYDVSHRGKAPNYNDEDEDF